MHRHTVAHDVQVRPVEIHNLPAFGILDPGVPDIPFRRNHPVERCGPTRHLVQIERSKRPYLAQCLPDTVPSDAATNGKNFRREAIHVFADPRWGNGFHKAEWRFHDLAKLNPSLPEVD